VRERRRREGRAAARRGPGGGIGYGAAAGVLSRPGPGSGMSQGSPGFRGAAGTGEDGGMPEVPTAPSHAPAGPEPGRVLRRHRDGGLFTGVCAGLGRYTGIDPVLFRVGFALLVLASGTGLLLYASAYLLMRQPDESPSHLERWTRRQFDAETVLALLGAVFAFGVLLNVASGGIDRGTIVIGTLLALTLLAAHARGVDLLALAKSMRERALRHGVPLATGRGDAPPPPRPGAYRRPGAWYVPRGPFHAPRDTGPAGPG